MLKQRVLTALALLAVILPSIFADQWTGSQALASWLWPILSLLFCAFAVWEWGRMTNAANIAQRAGILTFLLGACILTLELRFQQQTALLLAVLSLLFWLLWAPYRLAKLNAKPGSWPLAVVLVLAAWLSLVNVHRLGPWILIAAMAIVWIADIGAYFVGRALGRRKLAPKISPGKSWEGVWGGMFFVVIISLLVAAAPGLSNTLPSLLVKAWGPILAGLVLIVFCALSVLGDLHESLLKRQANVKDSSGLLPGHGGVFDRIDALLPTMPLAYLLHYLMGTSH